MELIASSTLSSPTATVSFNSIPSNFQDLFLVIEALANTGSTNVLLRINNTTTGYPMQSVYGDGTTSAAYGENSTFAGISVWPATTTSRIFITTSIFDYQTTKHKVILSRSNAVLSTFGPTAGVGRWSNTTTVTSISLITNSADSYAIGSTFYLYGIV